MRNLGRIWLPHSPSPNSHPWAPNIALNCLATGPDPRQDLSTILVIFVHGFPELAYSWRKQLDVVAHAGNFSCIAPDMRGYGNSSIPLQPEAYQFRYICQDLVALVKMMKREKAVFVGHDFGGSVVWSLVLHHPEVVAGVVGVNTPLMVLDDELLEIMTKAGGHIASLKKLPHSGETHLDYAIWFQQPNTEQELNNNPERTMNAYFRSQISPDSTRNRENMKLGMRTSKVRERKGILKLCPEVIPRDPLWSEEELDVYVQNFKKTGFPLNWYRAMDSNFMWDVEENCFHKKINVPCLQVCASRDLVLRAEDALKMKKRFTQPLQIVTLDCGHWTMIERTEEFNRVLIEYLTKTQFEIMTGSSGKSKL
jgi:soluble epoxide hydrolase/lipid-phosphate phosphatase